MVKEMTEEETNQEKLLCPKACILIQSSEEFTKIHGFAPLLDDGPALGEYNLRILKTLDDMLKDGKSRST